MTYEMTSEEIEQFERDHQALDLDSHQPHPEKYIMDFEVTYRVSVDLERATEEAADQGETDFNDDPEGTTAQMIQNEIEGESNDLYDVSGQVRVSHCRGT